MARTPTTQIELGFDAPEFSLPDVVSGKDISFQDIKGNKGTLVMFICNHCPFVVHVRDQLVKLANDYMARGIGVVAISSNDVINYPDDSPEKMKLMAEQFKFPFAYLYDETQDVAKAYYAACTPDFSVFDGAGKCVYRGQLDDARPGNEMPNDGRSLREVFDLLIENELVPSEGQKPSIGCNIKWK